MVLVQVTNLHEPYVNRKDRQKAALKGSAGNILQGSPMPELPLFTDVVSPKVEDVEESSLSMYVHCTWYKQYLRHIQFMFFAVAQFLYQRWAGTVRVSMLTFYPKISGLMAAALRAHWPRLPKFFDLLLSHFQGWKS